MAEAGATMEATAVEAGAMVAGEATAAVEVEKFTKS